MRRLIRFAVALTTLTLIFVYPRYKRQKQEALDRLRAGSKIAATSFGPIEYATVGTGQPILVMHGSGGWYEQGLLLAKIVDPQKYQIVSVSRPGYGRTPLETGRTPQKLADACVALLDQLQIEAAAVLGISAGGLGAIAFAQRYPTRCRALILISAVSAATQDIHAPDWMLSVLRVMMSSDFLMWLMLKVSSQSIIGLMTGGTDSEQILSLEQKQIIEGIVNGIFPTSLWRDGTISDIGQVQAISSEMLEQIKTPTIIIHGTNDTLIPYAVAQHSAAHIPDAKLITVQGGTHLLVGTHKDMVSTAIDELLAP